MVPRPLVATFAAALTLALCATTLAQDKLTGKLVEAEKGRRTSTIVVQTDAGKQSFTLSSRTELSVKGKGDDGFLQPGQFVAAIPVMSNKRLFAKEFTVVVRDGRDEPKARAGKAPPKPGRSKNAYIVAGEIVSRQQDEEYPEYETITIKVGRKSANVYLDKGYSVQVDLDDPSLAPPGSKVELEGRGSGDRFRPSSVTITLPKPVKSEEILQPEE